jgi:hypothetical protein
MHKPIVGPDSGLVEQALRVEWLTEGWMLIETVVAIGSGGLRNNLGGRDLYKQRSLLLSHTRSGVTPYCVQVYSLYRCTSEEIRC